METVKKISIADTVKLSARNTLMPVIDEQAEDIAVNSRNTEEFRTLVKNMTELIFEAYKQGNKN